MIFQTRLKNLNIMNSQEESVIKDCIIKSSENVFRSESEH